MNDKLTIGEWTFTNFPKKLSFKEYEETGAMIKKKISSFNCSTYIIMSNKDKLVPGISDIDFVTFIDGNTVSKKLKEIFSIESYKGMYKEIIYHDHLFIPNTISKSSGRILGGFILKMELLQGNKYTFNKVDKICHFLRGLDDFIIHTGRELYEPFLRKEINVRSILHTLRVVEHRSNSNIKLNKNFEKKVRIYSQKVNKLRKKWFSKDMESNCSKIVELLKEAIQIQDEEIKEFNIHIKKKFLKNKIPSGVFYDTYFPIIFKEYNKPSILVKKIFDEFGLIIPVFPPSFAFMLTTYSQEKGIIAEHIKKNISYKKSFIKEEFNSFLKERIYFYNKQSEFCKYNKLEYGPLVHFYLHETPSTIKAKISKPIKSFIKKIKIKKVLSNYV